MVRVSEIQEGIVFECPSAAPFFGTSLLRLGLEMYVFNTQCTKLKKTGNASRHEITKESVHIRGTRRTMPTLKSDKTGDSDVLCLQSNIREI